LQKDPIELELEQLGGTKYVGGGSLIDCKGDDVDKLFVVVTVVVKDEIPGSREQKHSLCASILKKAIIKQY